MGTPSARTTRPFAWRRCSTGWSPNAYPALPEREPHTAVQGESTQFRPRIRRPAATLPARGKYQRVEARLSDVADVLEVDEQPCEPGSRLNPALCEEPDDHVRFARRTVGIVLERLLTRVIHLEPQSITLLGLHAPDQPGGMPRSQRDVAPNVHADAGVGVPLGRAEVRIRSRHAGRPA